VSPDLEPRGPVQRKLFVKRWPKGHHPFRGFAAGIKYEFVWNLCSTSLLHLSIGINLHLKTSA
jgi:hypothetical protein